MLRIYKNIYFGISKKADGNMKIQERNKKILSNRKKFFSQLGIDYDKVLAANLAHENEILTLSYKNIANYSDNLGRHKEDGLVTNLKNVCLTVTVADCLPLYFYDHEKKVIGIAHAGWRGILKDIAGKMIVGMMKNFKCAPKDVIIYIGPHIKKCHFEVTNEVAEKFIAAGYKGHLARRDGEISVALAQIVSKQLITKGVPKNNIKVSRECTYCKKDKYFSYRRDKPRKIQAMVAYIGIWVDKK